jgi:type II restriction enzyme
MDTSLPLHLAKGYKNPSQIARRTTEPWARDNLYCPACGSRLSQCPPNTKSKDFDCLHCGEAFQLKSSRRNFTGKLTGADYDTEVASVLSGNHPSLILVRYTMATMRVSDVQFIHRSCITRSCITPRKPLKAGAQRAGWQGFMLDLGRIPSAARVDLLRAGQTTPRGDVIQKWNAIQGMLGVRPQHRGWTADVLKVVEKLGSTFRLEEVYAFDKDLARLHPENRNLRPKIRQQLQKLRNMRLLRFQGTGLYARL